MNEAAKKLPDEAAPLPPAALRAAVRAHAEDQADVADADAAWAEHGPAVPLEELEAEFGCA